MTVALQDRARVQRDVPAEVDGHVDERLARIEHRDAVEQPPPVGPARSSRSARASCQRSLTPWVSSAGAWTHPIRWPIAAEHADHVGQVELALGVVRRQVPQRRAEQVPAEGVDARRDLVHGELVGAGVALLDDAQRPAVGAADDPP